MGVGAGGRPQPRHGDASEEEIFQANLDHLRASTQTLMGMLQLGAKVGCAVGSMCWTLIEFARPVLATCDHPVVVWPMSDGGRPAQSVVPGEVGVWKAEWQEARAALTRASREAVPHL